MRTTVRIDDDLMRALKERARAQNISISRLLNQTLRQGLATKQPRKGKPLRQKTHAMGPARIELTKALSVAAAFENEVILRKMKAINSDHGLMCDEDR